jgi:holo-[acyl-carrier protein] synthase
MKNNIEETLLELIPKQEFALGNDLVYLPDFELSFNPLFQKKVYTLNEIEYCDQFEEKLLRYASTWAAKEAVYKAIKQHNLTALSFKKIEILRSKIAGKPTVNLPPFYKNLKVSLSISHDGDYVWALALIQQLKE